MHPFCENREGIEFFENLKTKEEKVAFINGMWEGHRQMEALQKMSAKELHDYLERVRNDDLTKGFFTEGTHPYDKRIAEVKEHIKTSEEPNWFTKLLSKFKKVKKWHTRKLKIKKSRSNG